jgi:PIN domain nuclease of toxin-antitoxin system
VILLDTCAFIWDALAPRQLSADARAAIERNAGELLVCDITFWEVAMLVRKGRLEIDCTPAAMIDLALQARNHAIQDITPEIAELSTNLAGELGDDPADRLIAASSILGNAPVVTADRRMRNSNLLETIW